MIRTTLFIAIFLTLINGTAAAGRPDLTEKISLQFKDVPITTILNMIAEQYGLNVILSGKITENVSIKLDEVELRDALNAVLASNGYNYYFVGDIIVVKPFELNAIGETVVKTITLDHISPAAAINAVSDLLSPKGKIKVVEDPEPSSGATISRSTPTTITVIDLPEAVDAVMELIRQIDTREQQVAILVRMIEINIDNDTNIGFTWPTTITGRGHGIEMISTTSTTADENEALGQIDLPYGRWEWGKLSVTEVKTILDFLVKKGNTKLISDPRITTLNNHEAEISVTTNVPIQTINRFSEGGAVQDIVTFQDEEVGITLLVTPHITDQGDILLDVSPTVAEIIGYSGPLDNQKPITSQRSVRTRIMVKDGETAVLGGLLRENKLEQEDSVFLLGSIPFIGSLFRHRSVQTSTTDLMIMITPTIVAD
ncbi:MAG: hypothetical protein JSV44_01830 [Candidatus Zixiibacteriota bacterium]|nr:MAG: hypothetical protein JSV44_01830 [candidate division Zixibacteria bacterium]